MSILSGDIKLLASQRLTDTPDGGGRVTGHEIVSGEHNSVVKAWDDVDVHWCLMYPDAYEVGQPNQGVAILYEILNERDWILAERTYSVWPDMEAQLRAHGIPQFTLDAHRPVG